MKFTMTIFCLFILSGSLFCQFLNNEFDNWTTIDTAGPPYDDLLDWDTNNEIIGFISPTTPNVRIQEMNDTGVSISTAYSGIDGTYSGAISQYIISDKLIDITYLSKCDSIFERGACVVNIYDESDLLIYTDSLKTKETSYSVKTIDISQIPVMNNELIKVEFKAFGQLGFFELFQAYSDFRLLNVNANYISSSTDLEFSNSVNIYPNPFDSKLNLKTTSSNKIVGSKLFDVNGNLLLDTNDLIIETSSLNTGVYFLLIETQEGTMTKTVLKQ